MIHLKMIGLGLLTIFKTIGLFILMILGLLLVATLFAGWIFFFRNGLNFIAWSILVIDLLIVSYFVGDVVYRESKKKVLEDV